MKKTMMLAVAALATLAACNKNEAPSVDLAENTPMAMAFDAYMNRGVITRSGLSAEIKLDQLKQGFGVFAYYTDFNAYDQNATPNFMYNQEVENDGSAWTYSPVKYWPNEYGTSAISDDMDKVTFFAYAPYVDVTPSTGKVGDASYGIAGMNRNTASGDPILKYIGSFDPRLSVDLCWGVVPGEFDTTANADNTYDWAIVETGNKQALPNSLTKSMPWIDVQRPAGVSQVLKFDFKHALSKLNVQIDADVDADTHADSGTALDASETKIYVRSISFTGFAMKGALNLNNDVPAKAKWLDYSGVNDIVSNEEFVIYDGRKDGREGVEGAIASNEKSLGLNFKIISNDKNSTPGVTEVPVNLFNKTKVSGNDILDDDTIDKAEPIYVIPVDETIKVVINYDVETKDNNLPTLLSDGKSYGSRINNVISKPITFGTATKFENGKAYTIKLHLGMNSVKFDADVTNWDGTDVNQTQNPYLPSNEAPQP